MTLPSLRRRYIISYVLAIGLIVVVSVLAHLATLSVISHERGSAEIVNISGKQRMLSQRLLALVEIQAGDRASPENVALIQSTADELENANRRLQAHARGLPEGEVKAELLPLFNATENGITALISEYTRLASSAGLATIAQRERMETLALGELFNKLNRSVALFEAQAEQGLSRISRIHTFQVGLILLILASEALFLFRPLLKQTLAALETEQQARQVAEDALTFQTETLASKSRFMTQMKTMFFKPLAEAQEKLDDAAEADPEMTQALICESRDSLNVAAKRAIALTREYENTSHTMELGSYWSRFSAEDQASA